MDYVRYAGSYKVYITYLPGARIYVGDVYRLPAGRWGAQAADGTRARIGVIFPSGSLPSSFSTRMAAADWLARYTRPTDLELMAMAFASEQ